MLQNHVENDVMFVSEPGRKAHLKLRPTFRRGSGY